MIALLNKPIKDNTHTKFACLINQAFSDLGADIATLNNAESHSVYKILKQKQLIFKNILTVIVSV